MEYRIRHADSSDLTAIAQLEACCFPPAEACTEKAFSERLMSYPECFWLLEENGNLLAAVNGMATNSTDLSDDMYSDARIHQTEGKWQMIFGVITRPDRMHQGLQHILMPEVIRETKNRGKKGLVLTCKKNLIGFYEQFGFSSEGISGSEHGGVVWYQMRLRF